MSKKNCPFDIISLTLSFHFISCYLILSELIATRSEMMMVKFNKKEKDWICNQCPKSYSTKGCLQRHWKFECGKEPKFHCPYCSYKSFRKFNLNSHIRLKHELESFVGSDFTSQANNVNKTLALPPIKREVDSVSVVVESRKSAEDISFITQSPDGVFDEPTKVGLVKQEPPDTTLGVIPPEHNHDPQSGPLLSFNEIPRRTFYNSDGVEGQQSNSTLSDSLPTSHYFKNLF
uniref:Longitudinals lacking protein, isoforms F/I/K/T n=1 Tax=Cacopsylla melanoneura TaxID=428564 RepID=A0A8D9ET36_9HEMI